MKFNDSKSSANNSIVDLNEPDESSDEEAKINQQMTEFHLDQQAKPLKEVNMPVEKPLKDNINKNGDVVFTYFAGIESISSMIELNSLKPLKED